MASNMHSDKKGYKAIHAVSKVSQCTLKAHSLKSMGLNANHNFCQGLTSLSSVKAAVASKQWSGPGKKTTGDLLGSTNVYCFIFASPQTRPRLPGTLYNSYHLLHAVKHSRPARLQAGRLQSAARVGNRQFWPCVPCQAYSNWASVCNQSTIKAAHTEKSAGSASASDCTDCMSSCMDHIAHSLHSRGHR